MTDIYKLLAQQARFREIESIILSDEVDKLSIKQLKTLRRELPLNIPATDKNAFQKDLMILDPIISSKINGFILKRRFRIQIGFAVITLAFVAWNLYLSHFYQSNANETQTQTSKQLKSKKAPSQ